MGSHELLVFWVLPICLPIRAVELRTEPRGFCNSNATKAVGRTTMLIASPDVRRIEIEAMTHISGGRQTNGFRGGPHRFLLALHHLKVASLGQGRLTTSMGVCHQWSPHGPHIIALQCFLDLAWNATYPESIARCPEELEGRRRTQPP